MYKSFAILCVALLAGEMQAQTPGVNFSNTTPAAPSGSVNVIWQHDNSNPVNISGSVSVGGLVSSIASFPGADFGAKLMNCVAAQSSTYGGVCDGRSSTGALTISETVILSTPNVLVNLPCATLTSAYQFIVPVGVRNVRIEGCTYQGGSNANGTAGGTVWVYTGSGNAFQIGDPTYAASTNGFWMQNVNINTASAGSTAQAMYFYRTQEIRLDNLYLNGNQSTGQTGITLDGSGNYAGGTFIDIVMNGFGTGWYLTGNTNPAGSFANASTFVKTHIVCPTSGGNPIAGTYGINVVYGDGNTWTGGDVEGCSTMFHLGANAVNNTILGLRNENSTTQYQADSGSSFNYVATGGTLFTGDLIDNGSRNSFWDSFHRTVNGIKGDWYASQQDATVTDHQRLGIGLGNERGRVTEYQTDYGYRWTEGLSDGTAGQQVWYVQDLLNNISRISVGQYLSPTAGVVTNVILNNGGCYSSSTPPTIGFTGGGGSSAAGTAVMAASSCSGGWTVSSVTMTAGGTSYTSQPTVTWTASNQVTAPNAVAEIATTGSTNNQTVFNSAGTGAVVINGSANSGTGGVVIDSGGATPSEIYFIDSSGNTSQWGQLNFYSGPTETWQWECQSLTGCQLRNANATTPMSPFIAYTNGGTELDSQGASSVVINNHSTAGTGGFIVYEGGANYNTAAFSVGSNGSATVANNLAVTNHLNQAATKDFAGTCSMSGTSTCTVSLQHSYSSTPLCFVQATTNNTTGVYCAVSSNNAVVTAAATNSLTWQVFVIGNPN